LSYHFGTITLPSHYAGKFKYAGLLPAKVSGNSKAGLLKKGEILADQLQFTVFITTPSDRLYRFLSGDIAGLSLARGCLKIQC
jgi:hypothetical protein